MSRTSFPAPSMEARIDYTFVGIYCTISGGRWENPPYPLSKWELGWWLEKYLQNEVGSCKINGQQIFIAIQDKPYNFWHQSYKVIHEWSNLLNGLRREENGHVFLLIIVFQFFVKYDIRFSVIFSSTLHSETKPTSTISNTTSSPSFCLQKMN